MRETRNPRRAAALLLIALFLLGQKAGAQDGIVAGAAIYLPTVYQLSGFYIVPTSATFNTVTAITNAGDDRLFVAEQSGLIRILHPSDNVTTFLDLRDEVIIENWEMGLLSLVFHPDYASNGTFFVAYTGSIYGREDRWLIVSRFTVSADPDVADPASAEEIIAIQQAYGFHNGGGLAFGPLDGHLYLGVGDDNLTMVAQDDNSPKGKVLRLNVEHIAGSLKPGAWPNTLLAVEAENWTSGLRNPWRFDFDPETGDLYIADVGDNEWEEVNFVSGGGSGHNFGWPCMEGPDLRSGLAGCENPGMFELPVHQYAHGPQCGMIIGGEVLRHRAGDAPRYIFGDGCTGNIYALSNEGSWLASLLGALPNSADILTTFGLDNGGRLYAGTYSARGPLYRLSLP